MKATAAVFAACFVYFALFRSYGFQVEDEGTLLFWLARVLRGDFPYVDFHTGYTPGYYVLGAALLKLAGGNANNLRLFVAVVNAASAAGMYVLSRRFVGGWMALAAPVLWVAFLPVYPGEFASFNVPYPAWFATLAWVAAALAVVKFVETGKTLHVGLAGLAAAFAFAMKPNAGAFALAAATWTVVVAAKVAGVRDRAVGLAAALGMGLGVWGAFGFAVWGVDALIHLTALAAVTLLACGPLAGRYALPASPSAWRALWTLALSFLLPTLLWAVPVLARLGVQGFASEVLLIGSDAASLYYQEWPAPEPYAVAVVLGVMGFAAGGLLARENLVSPVKLLALGGMAVLAIGALIVRTAVMPESAWLSISLQLENAAYWLGPLANTAGLLMLALSARRRTPAGRESELAVLVPWAVAMYWQLYPRTDFMHVITAVPLSMVLATWLLARVRTWWSEATWPAGVSPRSLIGSGLAVVVAVLVVLEIGPMLLSVRVCLTGAPLVVETERLHACVDPAVADDLAAFGRAAGYLESNAAREENVLPFPAVAGLLFAAGLTSPVPHDYWYPGRPSHEDEARMLATLRAEPPRLIATLNRNWTFFIGSPPYFQDTRRFVTDTYRLVARYGRFDVLARNDVVARGDVAPALNEEAATEPAATAKEAADPWLPARRANAQRWMAHVTPEEAARASVPRDTGRAILLVRALRDGGDIRGTGWLMAAYSSTNPRTRHEAESAMKRVAEEFEARRYRWAGDFDAASYRPYVAPYANALTALEHASDEGPRKLAAAMKYLLEPAPELAAEAPGR